jgi:hypothetical protein
MKRQRLAPLSLSLSEQAVVRWSFIVKRFQRERKYPPQRDEGISPARGLPMQRQRIFLRPRRGVNTRNQLSTDDVNIRMMTTKTTVCDMMPSTWRHSAGCSIGYLAILRRRSKPVSIPHQVNTATSILSSTVSILQNDDDVTETR